MVARILDLPEAALHGVAHTRGLGRSLGQGATFGQKKSEVILRDRRERLSNLALGEGEGKVPARCGEKPDP